MKELTIEEKAKRYDEAIERAKYWEKNPTVWSSDDICQELFPELKESEDEKIIERIKKAVESYWSDEPLDEILAWLEKQGEKSIVLRDAFGYEEGRQRGREEGIILVLEKPQKYGLEMQGERKNVWSEEDEKTYSRIYNLIHAAAFENYDVNEDGKECGEYAKIIGWFKDLKDRYTWKPSDAQMDSITCAVRKMKESACYDSELVSLYNDLKKLREE